VLSYASTPTAITSLRIIPGFEMKQYIINTRYYYWIKKAYRPGVIHRRGYGKDTHIIE
jgi:hypothetical protein